MRSLEAVNDKKASDLGPSRICRAWVPVVAVHVSLLAVWQAVASFALVPAFVLPAPSAILATLVEPGYDWPGNILATAYEIFCGYALAAAVGIMLGLLFTWSRTLTLLFFPLLVTLNMIPKVALGPLMVVWLSYGIATNILIAFSLCVFPVLLTTIRGLREADPDLLDLVRSLRGSRWQAFRYIQLPNAMPHIFSGLKVGTVLAVAGATVGEFIASERGLGYLMLQVQAALDTPAMFMAAILLTLVGLLLYLLVLGLEQAMVVQDARLT